MSNTTFVDGSTRTAAAWFQTLNDIAYLLLQAADGVTLTPAAVRAALASNGLLTAVAGTNTITATSSPVQAAYVSGQSFVLIPAVTNTGATTLNISGLGAKNIFVNGAACFGGELVFGSPVIVEYDGTQFNAIGWTMPTLTISLAADVAMNNTASYFPGPTVAQGTIGRWEASGTVTMLDTITGAKFDAKLWDGTSLIASASSVAVGANSPISISLSGRITSPTGNIRIDVKDASSTNGVLLFNTTGNSKDSTLTVKRIG